MRGAARTSVPWGIGSVRTYGYHWLWPRDPERRDEHTHKEGRGLRTATRSVLPTTHPPGGVVAAKPSRGEIQREEGPETHPPGPP